MSIIFITGSPGIINREYSLSYLEMTDNLRMYRLRELPRKMFRLIVFFFLPCVSVFLRLQHRLALICWNRGQVQDFFGAQFLGWELQLLPKCQWYPGNNHRMCILWNFSYFVHDCGPPREWVENRSQNHVTPIFNFICKKMKIQETMIFNKIRKISITDLGGLWLLLWKTHLLLKNLVTGKNMFLQYTVSLMVI